MPDRSQLQQSSVLDEQTYKVISPPVEPGAFRLAYCIFNGILTGRMPTQGPVRIVGSSPDGKDRAMPDALHHRAMHEVAMWCVASSINPNPVINRLLKIADVAMRGTWPDDAGANRANPYASTASEPMLDAVARVRLVVEDGWLQVDYSHLDELLKDKSKIQEKER